MIRRLLNIANYNRAISLHSAGGTGMARKTLAAVCAATALVGVSLISLTRQSSIAGASWEVPAGGSGSAGFTNTGLGHDGTDMLIGDFTNGRIVKTSVAGAYVGEIVLGGTPPANSVQGVTWDSSRSHYWVGHYVAPGSAGSLRRYNASGALQDTIATASVGGPNGIVYDAANDRILACFDDGHVRGYDCTDGSLDEDITTSGLGTGSGAGLDGLDIDPSDSTRLWVSSDLTTGNRVAKINRTTGATVSYWVCPKNPEGLKWINGTLYMCADGEYHSSIADGNRVWTLSGLSLLTGLVSYYQLDEASGNAIDAHGANDLTETGGTIASTTGKVSNARDFEAADAEHFTVSDTADLSITGDMTVSMWVNMESKTAQQLFVGKWLSAGNQKSWYIERDHGADRFRWHISDNGTNNVIVTCNLFGATTTAAWHHILVMHDASANICTITVNQGGQEVTAHSTGIYDSTAAFGIGAGDGIVLPTDGLLDEVGVWNRALTFEEQAALYNGGSGAAYATFTEPSGGLLRALMLYSSLDSRHQQSHLARYGVYSLLP